MMHEGSDLVSPFSPAETEMSDEYPNRQAVDIQVRIYGPFWLASGHAQIDVLDIRDMTIDKQSISIVAIFPINSGTRNDGKAPPAGKSIKLACLGFGERVNLL
jgi:hypothetical protein